MAAQKLMVIGLAQVLVTALVFLAARASADDVSQAHRKCKLVLSKISQETPYTDVELAALCRSRAPLPICREALSGLGAKPWAPERIAATCDRWRRDFEMRLLEKSPTRQRQMMGDLQASVDAVTGKKVALGVCSDQTVDECARTKKEEYPTYDGKLTDTVQLKSELEPQEYAIAPKVGDLPPMPQSTSLTEDAREGTVSSTTASETSRESEAVTTTAAPENTESSTEVAAMGIASTAGQDGQESALVTSADTRMSATTSGPIQADETAQLQQKDLILSDAEVAPPAGSPSWSFLFLIGLPSLLLFAVASSASLLRAAQRAPGASAGAAALPDDEERVPVRSCDDVAQ